MIVITNLQADGRETLDQVVCNDVITDSNKLMC